MGKPEQLDFLEVPGFEPVPPDSPTDAEPGSPEKIAVMELRHRMGMEIHHPDDRKIQSHPMPVWQGPQVERRTVSESDVWYAEQESSSLEED